MVGPSMVRSTLHNRRPVQQLRQQIDGQALIPPDSAVVPSQRLRSALTSAVALRVAHDPDLSCDLSGGLDSTSIAVLAAHATYPPQRRRRPR
ncbi:asparagine synthase-related protein [Streptomyces noursei]|uniref:asparagine synthase-related protein n=1 Tax=Streptomyces noursei TaxID=1971 RepID=UPI00382B1FEC